MEWIAPGVWAFVFAVLAIVLLAGLLGFLMMWRELGNVEAWARDYRLEDPDDGWDRDDEGWPPDVA